MQNNNKESYFLKLFRSRKVMMRIELLQFLELDEMVKINQLNQEFNKMIDPNKNK